MIAAALLAAYVISCEGTGVIVDNMTSPAAIVRDPKMPTQRFEIDPANGTVRRFLVAKQAWGDVCAGVDCEFRSNDGDILAVSATAVAGTTVEFSYDPRTGLASHTIMIANNDQRKHLNIWLMACRPT